MKATEQSFPVVLFIVLYTVILTSESVDKILKCDHSNESYWAVLSCGAVYDAAHGDSNFWFCGWNPKVWPFKWKLLIEQYFPVVLFIVMYKVVLTFESVDEILKFDHSNESYRAVLYCGAVCRPLINVRFHKSILAKTSRIFNLVHHLWSNCCSCFKRRCPHSASSSLLSDSCESCSCVQ